MCSLRLQEHRDAVSFEVRVSTRSSRDAIQAVQEGVLRIALTAPPVEGEANAALIRLLARALGVPRSSLAIIRGERSRNKAVRVQGLGTEAIRRALERPDA